MNCCAYLAGQVVGAILPDGTEEHLSIPYLLDALVSRSTSPRSLSRSYECTDFTLEVAKHTVTLLNFKRYTSNPRKLSRQELHDNDCMFSLVIGVRRLLSRQFIDKVRFNNK